MRKVAFNCTLNMWNTEHENTYKKKTPGYNNYNKILNILFYTRNLKKIPIFSDDTQGFA